jgi:hypothetical protein
MQEFRVFRAIGLAVKTWFRNFIPFTLLTALLYLPIVYWVATVEPSEITEATDIALPIILIGALTTFLPCFMTYRVIQELNGSRVSMLTSIMYGFRGLLPSLLFAIIYAVVGFLPMGGIAQIILLCIWYVAAPAAVAEKIGPFAAFTRSSILTQGRRWAIFGIIVLVGIIKWTVILIYAVPLLSESSDPSEGQIRTMLVFAVSVFGLFETFGGVVSAVSYCLLRQDKEGVTHEDLARVFE